MRVSKNVQINVNIIDMLPSNDDIHIQVTRKRKKKRQNEEIVPKIKTSM